MFIPAEIIKNQLIRVPFVKNQAKKQHSTGLNQNMDEVEMVVKYYLDRLPSFDNTQVLEIGPGHTYQVAQLISERNNAKVTMVDVERYIEDEQLNGMNVDLIMYDGKTIPMESESMDHVISYTVYEHLRFPKTTVEETFRLLKPGGHAAHNIDLRDHYSFGKNEDDLFNCLRYSETVWNWMAWNRGAYVNRVRYSQWIELHEQAGFEILRTDKKESEHIRKLYNEGKLQYLSEVPEGDRFATEIDIVVRKPLK